MWCLQITDRLDACLKSLLRAALVVSVVAKLD